MLDHLDKIYSLTFNTIRQFPIGEVYLEDYENFNVQMSNNKISTITNSRDQGFSIRTVNENNKINFHANIFSIDNIKDAIGTIDQYNYKYRGLVTRNIYNNYLQYKSLENIKLMMSFLNQSIRQYNGKATIDNVFISVSQEKKNVFIIRNDNQIINDFRPMLRFIVVTYITYKNRKEKIFLSKSERSDWKSLDKFKNFIITETMRKIKVFEEAEKYKTNTCPVLFAPGSPGILLHEAIGHGLEGDFNIKNISVFSGLIGQKISHDEVTIVDDGTIKNERGSINFDDEGNESKRNILVENGILRKYLVDRISGQKLNMEPSSGRRESYCDLPMPRMTNTFMLSGSSTKEEMIKNMDNGIYAVDFSNGSVDIVSGQFAFVCSEAYRVENGEIVEPIQGCTISGVGIETLQNITMVGNDSQLATDGGTCGKDGQYVPVGVGQPHILVNNMIISG